MHPQTNKKNMGKERFIFIMVFTTSISSIRTNSQHRGYTYDLQGRRVGANVAHGIYISEGKKVYAK